MYSTYSHYAFFPALIVSMEVVMGLSKWKMQSAVVIL